MDKWELVTLPPTTTHMFNIHSQTRVTLSSFKNISWNSKVLLLELAWLKSIFR